jgi:hypothetical protein
LVAGTVASRKRFSGKNERGDWEMFKIEVRGSDGRTTMVTISDAKLAPAVGEPVVLPVYINKMGNLCECRSFGDDF